MMARRPGEAGAAELSLEELVGATPWLARPPATRLDRAVGAPTLSQTMYRSEAAGVPLGSSPVRGEAHAPSSRSSGRYVRRPNGGASELDRGTGRVELHRAVRTGLHRHHPALPGTAAGQPVFEGQRSRRHRPGTQQPLAGGRGRGVSRDVRQPVLRQAQRPHDLSARHATALDGDWAARWVGRDSRGRGGAQHRGRPGRLVHRAGVLQRVAGGAGRGAARPGPGRPTWPCRRCPGHLSAHRVGQRHLRRPAVHRQHPRDVPGPVRDRRVLHPALRRNTEGPPPGRCGQARLVVAGVRERVLRQPAEEPRLRVGVREPVHVRPGLRVPDHVPGLLPAGEARQRRGRRPAASCSSPPWPCRAWSSSRPWSAGGSRTGPVGARSSCALRRSCSAWPCSSSRSPAASTASWSAWPSAGSGSACTPPWTWHWSPTCSRTLPAPRRIWA